ncbi:MAG: hypothetical protein ACFBSD_14570 [Paracoccaceae bacterium]
MTEVEIRLGELLEPARHRTLRALAAAYHQATEQAEAVEPEPLHRDAAGRVLREGELGLPRRADLAVTRGGRTLLRRVESEEPPPFEPVSLLIPGGFTLVVGPCRWEAVGLRVEARQQAPDWQRLRLWYLDWVQGRPGPAKGGTPLSGAVHALTGPAAARGGWVFEADFGSAPIAAVAGLVGALAQSGASRLRLGEAY